MFVLFILIVIDIQILTLPVPSQVDQFVSICQLFLRFCNWRMKSHLHCKCIGKWSCIYAWICNCRIICFDHLHPYDINFNVSYVDCIVTGLLWWEGRLLPGDQLFVADSDKYDQFSCEICKIWEEIHITLNNSLDGLAWLQTRGGIFGYFRSPGLGNIFRVESRLPVLLNLSKMHEIVTPVRAKLGMKM